MLAPTNIHPEQRHRSRWGADGKYAPNFGKNYIDINYEHSHINTTLFEGVYLP